MKRKLFIPLITIALLLLVSCNKVELNQKMEMQRVTLNVSTRSPEGNSSDVWQKDDKIAVFTQQNQVKQFQFDETNWQPVDGEQFYSEVPGTFFGVYPAAISPNCTIPNDQSTTEKLRSADYMSSDNVQLTDFRQPLNLAFKHRLTKVEITITEYKNEFDEDIPTVASPKFSAYTNVERESDGSTALSAQNLTDITPLFTEDNSQGKHKFEVLIAPGEYEKKFTCVVEGKELSSTLPLNLEEGKTYRFNLKVGKEVLKLNAPQVTDFVESWNGEVAIDYIPPKVGDYLYSDGKWGAMDINKYPIGVIFSTQTSDIDKVAGYRNGYAISMAFTHNESFRYENNHILTDADISYKWLSWTEKAANKDGRTETLALNNSEHFAIQAALGYNPPLVSSSIPVPGTSEWFVPSLGQAYDIFVNLIGLPSEPSSIFVGQLSWGNHVYKDQGQRANKYFSDWQRTEYDNIAGDNEKTWWTSTRFAESMFFGVEPFWSNGWTIVRKEKYSTCYVRPAIAF